MGEAFPRPGPIVTALAIPIMYHPAKCKLVVAEQLGSRALRADEEDLLTLLPQHCSKVTITVPTIPNWVHRCGRCRARRISADTHYPRLRRPD
jgi:hypothetical protein